MGISDKMEVDNHHWWRDNLRALSNDRIAICGSWCISKFHNGVARKPSKHCAAQYDMWGFHLKNQWFDGKCESVKELMSAGTLTEAWK